MRQHIDGDSVVIGVSKAGRTEMGYLSRRVHLWVFPRNRLNRGSYIQAPMKGVDPPV